jgi:hypothetical protein
VLTNCALLLPRVDAPKCATECFASFAERGVFQQPRDFLPTETDMPVFKVNRLQLGSSIMFNDYSLTDKGSTCGVVFRARR